MNTRRKRYMEAFRRFNEARVAAGELTQYNLDVNMDEISGWPTPLIIKRCQDLGISPLPRELKTDGCTCAPLDFSHLVRNDPEVFVVQPAEVNPLCVVHGVNTMPSGTTVVSVETLRAQLRELIVRWQRQADASSLRPYATAKRSCAKELQAVLE